MGLFFLAVLKTVQLGWEMSSAHWASHPLDGRGPQLGTWWVWWSRASRPLDGRAQDYAVSGLLDGRGSLWWSRGVKPVGGGHRALCPWDEIEASWMGSRHWASHPLRNSGTSVLCLFDARGDMVGALRLFDRRGSQWV